MKARLAEIQFRGGALDGATLAIPLRRLPAELWVDERVEGNFVAVFPWDAWLSVRPRARHYRLACINAQGGVYTPATIALHTDPART